MSVTHYSAEFRLRDTITALRLVMPDVLLRERELAHAKWYAYRFMSPLEATAHFADLYRAGFKTYIRQHRDLHDAESAQGLGSRIMGQPSRSLTELWNARQRADELGLPYNLLIEFGFHFAGRRRRKRAPRPAQLFGSRKADVAWPIEIEKWLEDPLRLAVWRLDWLPQYRVENYRGFPVQDEFRDYLLEAMKERTGAWGPKLERQCLKQRHLPIRLAMKAVPKGVRSEVVRHLRSETENSPARVCVDQLPDIAFAPACFGIPYAHDAASVTCASCLLASLCSEALTHASERMLALYGVLSPLDDSRKANAREKTKLRVQKFRRSRNEPAGEVSPLPGANQM